MRERLDVCYLASSVVSQVYNKCRIFIRPALYFLPGDLLKSTLFPPKNCSFYLQLLFHFECSFISFRYSRHKLKSHFMKGNYSSFHVWKLSFFIVELDLNNIKKWIPGELKSVLSVWSPGTTYNAEENKCKLMNYWYYSERLSRIIIVYNWHQKI